ncbi:NADH:ubiquinone oxidoreductase subunit 5 [Flavobacterium limnosediminis JC2902]|uniref:NADH:ubiquinone oxidoreductase subunit 5 n=1 Tax=Flavobacterium limnosediminis JC2902 TaxID=1341181 RepID=V6SI56_9FLAO|nr:GxxExxY protein [Flavobacterium limnosediminis]ESU26251.1 NADH:ubiquinone oxidoreductase subunit 5 [Flavobacterium limnosediminis JC2902]
MPNIIHKTESYKLLGLLFEVHNNLGKGFLEIVYKDAIEYELEKSKILFDREKEYAVNYKDIILKHKFYADFIVFDKIILEVKSCSHISDSHIAQAMNYLKVSGNNLAIIANFNNESLEYKRIVI